MTTRFALHHHPLSSYCHKVLVALYEAGVDFEPVVVDLGDPVQRAALVALWPMGKFPVLVDSVRGVTLPESTTIIEHLAMHGGARALIPADPDLALDVRAQDRFFDLYVHQPMQQIVADLLRPEAERDRVAVAQARAVLETAYDLAEARLQRDSFAGGATFTLADCAAVPALFYAHLAHPMGDRRPNLAGYLRRSMARPSVARVLREAGPWFHLYPLQDRIDATYPGLRA